jgi:hypothetical protein
MGYYIRILGLQDPDLHIDELNDALIADALTAKFEFDQDEKPNQWTIINVSNQDDEVLAQIERNPVVDGELGKDELDEFREIIQDFKPLSAVKWLADYFDKVKVIYAIQLLSPAFEGVNFEIVSSIKNKIWDKTGGIVQADNEGFTNEDGYQILWQFTDGVTGEWSCAVINSEGQWDMFSMDLGNMTQRQEFQNGEVPKNAKQI